MTGTTLARVYLSLVLVPMALLWVKPSNHPSAGDNIRASIRFLSAKKMRSYDPEAPVVFDRAIHTNGKLWSHKIVAEVTVKNVDREPCAFAFKWFDPDGKLIDASEHRWPDPHLRTVYRGHWSMFPIVYGLEFKDRRLGKYTLTVEHPEGTVIAEKSFNIYRPDADRAGFLARNSRTVIAIVAGIVLLGLSIAATRVMA